MMARFDESELLAFVEGELDAPTLRRMEEALAEEPALFEQLRRLQADRIALQSLPDPEPTGDLVGDLEIALARPMLMDERPGAYRRRHRRRALPRLVGRTLAAAAAIALLVGGGWIVARQALLRSAPGAPERIAVEPPSAPGPAPMPTDVLEGALAVVHEAPLALEPLGASAPAPRTIDPDALRAVAPFAVALALPPREAETTVAAIVERAPASTLLVRNLTDREVRTVLDRMMALARDGAAAPAWASAGIGATDDAARPVDLRDARRALAAEQLDLDPRDLGGPLAGDDAYEPSVAAQLAAARAGARLTIVVPRERVETVVAELQAAAEARCSVRMIGTVAEASWLEQLRAIRGWLADAERNEIALVELPVQIVAAR